MIYHFHLDTNEEDNQSAGNETTKGNENSKSRACRRSSRLGKLLFLLKSILFLHCESKYLLLLNAYVVYLFSASRTPNASSGRNTCDVEVDDVDQSESNVTAEQSGGHTKMDKPAPRRSARLSKAGMKNSCTCKFFM